MLCLYHYFPPLGVGMEMIGNSIPEQGIGFGYSQWLLLPPSHLSLPHSQMEKLWVCPEHLERCLISQGIL